MIHLHTESIHPSWQGIFNQALAQLAPDYRRSLEQSQDWLPGPAKIFKAFTLPLNQVNYILFGESPYPRAASANGYAFWDGQVGAIWSETGLTKPVNRATSLRHLVKMLLVAEGALKPDDTGQEAIAQLDKRPYVQTLAELFQNALDRGILLLNASLVLTDKPVAQDVKAWQAFMGELLKGIYQARPGTHLILLGNLAKTIDKLPALSKFSKTYAEHPYNVSFVTNSCVQDLFRPLQLLQQTR